MGYLTKASEQSLFSHSASLWPNPTSQFSYRCNFLWYRPGQYQQPDHDHLITDVRRESNGNHNDLRGNDRLVWNGGATYYNMGRLSNICRKLHTSD